VHQSVLPPFRKEAPVGLQNKNDLA
jgi:hypothetical protein